MEPELYELLQTPVTVNRYVSEDSFGNNTYGDAVSLTCRIDQIMYALGEPEQQEQKSSSPTTRWQMITGVLSTPLAVRDRVTLPDGTVAYIQDAETLYDEYGIPHHAVFTVSTEGES